MKSRADEKWGVPSVVLAWGEFTVCVSGWYINGAYQAGAATWEVHDDGSTTFKWREGE